MRAIEAEIENDSQVGRTTELQGGRATKAPSNLVVLSSIRSIVPFSLFLIYYRSYRYYRPPPLPEPLTECSTTDTITLEATRSQSVKQDRKIFYGSAEPKFCKSREGTVSFLKYTSIREPNLERIAERKGKERKASHAPVVCSISSAVCRHILKLYFYTSAPPPTSRESCVDEETADFSRRLQARYLYTR